MSKIGVIGDSDSVLGFKSLGIDVYPATGGEVMKTINRLASGGYSIIFITEQAAELAEETIDRYKTMPFPAIIPIPSNRGTTGLGMRNIRANVEKAIGADILFGDEQTEVLYPGVVPDQNQSYTSACCFVGKKKT